MCIRRTTSEILKCYSYHTEHHLLCTYTTHTSYMNRTERFTHYIIVYAEAITRHSLYICLVLLFSLFHSFVRSLIRSICRSFGVRFLYLSLVSFMPSVCTVFVYIIPLSTVLTQSSFTHDLFRFLRA